MTTHLRGRLSRRRALQLVAAGAAAWLAAPLGKLGTARPWAAPASYRVGVGNLPDPYAATQRAVAASGEWPAAAIAGRTVMIKPNLVTAATPDTGTTTDPQVVRALVDLALDSGAGQVSIVESGPHGPNFSPCGYDFFASYDPRVSLVDLDSLPTRLVRVPGGMAYRILYMPAPVLDTNVVFISAGKLKTHGDSAVSLAMKNLFGLPPHRFYRLPGNPSQARFAMHYRSVSQTIIDLNLARRIDFAVIDGVWGMEGDGPFNGSPVEMDVVLAGRNALAVDRVALQAMGISQTAVQHLRYASGKGLGPADTASITLAGDPLPTRSFAPALPRPDIDMPTCQPASFSPGLGQSTSISYVIDRPGRTTVEALRTSELVSFVEHVRTVQDWTDVAAGLNTLAWDGRDDGGNVLPAGRYGVRVRAEATDRVLDTFAINWVQVA
ncbi:MAG TPA: DUF362 domain-containing protein [Dehalococcoidia bacterium]|nr:DUF362 domain-containing protein [Dehalococcoidia bacterium]